ncbi:hypothetical protein JCM17823_16600 [Halorubrum gandharaense]
MRAEQVAEEGDGEAAGEGGVDASTPADDVAAAPERDAADAVRILAERALRAGSPSARGRHETRLGAAPMLSRRGPK